MQDSCPAKFQQIRGFDLGVRETKNQKKNTNVNFNYGMCGQFTGAVRILNQEVNNLLGSNPKYESVYWFFFTDG